MRAIPPSSYKTFTPEERFRLILAAGEAEEDRLIGSSPLIPVRMRDIFPHLMAFQSVALLAFVELLDHAADAEAAWLAAESSVENEEGSDRWARIATAHGYRLRTRWLGWVRFCEEMMGPPRHFWAGLPGLDRIDEEPEGGRASRVFGRRVRDIVNALRPTGQPPVTEVRATVEADAAALRQMFDGHLDLHSVK